MSYPPRVMVNLNPESVRSIPMVPLPLKDDAALSAAISVAKSSEYFVSWSMGVYNHG